MRGFLLAALLAALLAGCATAEVGYADIVDGNRNTESTTPPLEDVRRQKRIQVRVAVYVVPAAEAGAIPNLRLLEDANVRVSGQENFARHGMEVYVTRPGHSEQIEERLKGRGATWRVPAGFVTTGDTLELDIVTHDRRSIELAQPSDGGVVKESIEMDGSMVSIQPVAAPGGGVDIILSPLLRRVGGEIEPWTLPGLEAATVIDEERVIVVAPAGADDGRFGSAFLGTGAGEKIVLVISASVLR